MEVAEAITTRRAKRTLDARPVSNDIVRELVEAMRLSASCNNNQPWRVVIARDNESLAKVKSALSKGNVWATRSPLILVVAAKPEDDCRLSDNRDYFLFSTGLAVGQMLLRATELGIIAHPIAGFNPVEAKRLLEIPNEYVVITFVICGYLGTDASLLSEKQVEIEKKRPDRKPLGESFFDGKWGAALTI
ncbi:MAG: nitroreductase family protein [Methanomassiliicoccales archaeon]|nr:nitroreductase family protein [Methanomassiliicoccales archaeon]